MTSHQDSPATPTATLLGMAGMLLLAAAYLVACHIVTTGYPQWAPWFYLAPVLLMLFSFLAHRLGGRWAALVMAAVLGALALALPMWQGDRSVLYLAQHVLTNLALCGLFGHTLLGGREPLVTRVARVVRRNDMPDDVLAFTRATTLAWTLFFAGVVAVSVLLYLCASIVVWSTFVNLINGPLVALMFVGEYAVRRYRFRGRPHHGLMESINAFRQPRPVAKRDVPAP